MQVLSEEYQPFYGIIPQSEFITIKKTAHKRAASTYEGYSQNQYHYNTKKALRQIVSVHSGCRGIVISCIL